MESACYLSYVAEIEGTHHCNSDAVLEIGAVKIQNSSFRSIIS